MSLVILGILAAGLWAAGRWDREFFFSAGTKPGLLAASLLGAGLLRWRFGQADLWQQFLLAVVFGCLLFACATDMAFCQVYNMTWWVGVPAGALLFWSRCLREPQNAKGAAELAVFFALQLLWFARMYGRADCYAFCVCALAQAGLGMGLLAYLSHMAAAFLMLALIQGRKGNLGRGGNLKRPVPFVPYITAAFYLMLAAQALLQRIFQWRIAGFRLMILETMAIC